MARFYSIPGVSNVSRDEDPKPPSRHPKAREYYESVAKRAGSNRFVSGFTEGDPVDWKGTPGRVEHVDFNEHTGTERIYSRGEKSGTFITEWQKRADGDAIITNTKVTHE